MASIHGDCQHMRNSRFTWPASSKLQAHNKTYGLHTNAKLADDLKCGHARPKLNNRIKELLLAGNDPWYKALRASHTSDTDMRHRPQGHRERMQEHLSSQLRSPQAQEYTDIPPMKSTATIKLM